MARQFREVVDSYPGSVKFKNVEKRFKIHAPVEGKAVIQFEFNESQDNGSEVIYHGKTSRNIAFARGGAHLPIAHALRLLSTQELQFGLTKLNSKKNFNFLGKPLLGEKYVEGRKKEQ